MKLFVPQPNNDMKKIMIKQPVVINLLILPLWEILLMSLSPLSLISFFIADVSLQEPKSNCAKNINTRMAFCFICFEFLFDKSLYSDIVYIDGKSKQKIQ